MIVAAEIPELAACEVDEVRFDAFPDGTLDPQSEPAERFALELDRALGRPYTALAVRHGASEWALGARMLKSELVSLPQELSAQALEVALPPDGELAVLVDGEQAVDPLEPALAAAAGELERRGRERFEFFVARADKLADGRFELSVDPL